jgi:hydroxymethylbilane synthase
MAHLIIATHTTRLALSQYKVIKTKLEHLHPGLLVGLDLIESAAAAAFQAAATEALLSRRVDAVLHDLRELPCVLPLDFHLAAISERGDAREALVVRTDWQAHVKSLAELPAEARLGVNGAARRAQLLALRSDWQLCELTTPLETRLQQLDAGEVDALLLAFASLSALGEDARLAALIEPDEILPVAGQGALALQTRLEDQRTNLLLEALNHWPTRYATEAERAVLSNLPDAEHYPVAALARLSEVVEDESQLMLTALLADPAGQRVARQCRSGPLWQGELLGSELALALMQNGARVLPVTNAPTSSAGSFAPDLSSLQIQSATEAAKPQVANEPVLAGVPAAGWFSTTALRQPVLAFVKEGAQEFDFVAAKARRVREQKPFYDRRILIARANRHNAELVKTLETLGATVSICPTMRLNEPESWEALDRMLLHLSWHEWLTFVSAPSVTYFLKRHAELGHHRSEIEARRICAVGEAAAATLRAAGIQPDLVVEQSTPECLAEAVLKPHGLRARSHGTTMLLIAWPALAEAWRPALNKVGLYVEAVAAYRLALPESGAETLAELRDETFNYVIFNSAASVENLAMVVEPQTLPVFLCEARVLCSNEEAREAAQAHGLTVHLQPSEISVSGLVRALREDCLSNQLA